jgi:hypothetical protein
MESMMFGVWEILNERCPERSFSIGFRNSINKTLGVGLVSGNKVTVCDNLLFSGEFIQFRRHTGTFTLEELDVMTMESVTKAIQQGEELNKWHDSLRDFTIGDRAKKEITYNLLDKKVIPSTKFHEFKTLLGIENHIEGQQNLYSIHGTVTRMVKDKSLFYIADTSKKLIGVCDDWMESEKAA